MRSETETIIGALRVLANDIQSQDGVANVKVHTPLPATATDETGGKP